MDRGKKIWIAIFLVFLGAGSAWGQEGAAGAAPNGQGVPGAIGTTEVCPCTTGPLIADTAVPLDKGKFAVQATGYLHFTTGNFSPSWRRVSAGGDFGSLYLPVKFSYGLLENLEVNLYVPLSYNWARNVDAPGPRGERAADFGGLADINLTLKYRLLAEKDWWPTVTGLFSVDFPTGHNFPLNPGRLGTDALGGGSYGFWYGFNISKWVKPVILYANLWHYTATSSKTTVQRQVSDDVTVEETQRLHGRDCLYLRLALEYPLGGKGPWVALFEFYSSFETGRLFSPNTNASSPSAAKLGLMPGLEYVYSERLAFAAGLAVDLAGKNTAVELTPIATVIVTF